jgi:hypothetical protein
MKSIIIRELKSRGIRKVSGKKIEHYNFYTLCFFLEQAERGEVLK